MEKADGNVNNDFKAIQSKNGEWKTLQHQGPLFPPQYEPLPDDVHFKYDGKRKKLQPKSEEVMTFYAKITNGVYKSNEVFRKNFFNDWKTVMSKEEKNEITELEKCDFSVVLKYFKSISKKKTKNKTEGYEFCIWDGCEEKIENFKLEPPGLFMGRGDHPKNGRVKKRIAPEQITINCSRDKIPNPPTGHKWKSVCHNNNVFWLASWEDRVAEKTKYIKLHPSSQIQVGKRDKQKYDIARQLGSKIEEIQKNYYEDLDSSDPMKKESAVALYFIDKLAMRPGNEKNEDNSANTFGCCTLRWEHIRLHEHLDDEYNVVKFDFLGKDYVRYVRTVSVLEKVFKNLEEFRKNNTDKVFSTVNNSTLNKHLNKFMDGLTVKVFRTYNASSTFEAELIKLTNQNCKDDHDEKSLLECHKQANMIAAEKLNHRRSVSQNRKNDEISPETTKRHYMDPRITVAWCKKHKVSVEKVFTKADCDKFSWAIDVDDETFKFNKNDMK
ncbi:DNA topoisomerase 1-like [Clavelina lepadiformis]|uniref:DNA topoisomerase 1-like n=1 Tax=Clavelina lepadiformis TaxID=159417 RepID=UPI0040410EE5